MDGIKYYGSTAFISQIGPQLLLKSPFIPNTTDPGIEEFKEQVRLAFAIEEPILKKLGDHPRIVQYLGKLNSGLLLREASHGNLQDYLDSQHNFISQSLRRKWCRQATEAVIYVHECGVIHADMRPENFLVHESSPGCLDILICDFGGSKCDGLHLDGKHLPDTPFYDPTQEDCNYGVDIFSLGSMFYTVLKGVWPYRSSREKLSSNEFWDYDAQVTEHFLRGEFPNVSDLIEAQVIVGCWTKRYRTAREILTALDDVYSAL